MATLIILGTAMLVVTIRGMRIPMAYYRIVAYQFATFADETVGKLRLLHLAVYVEAVFAANAYETESVWARIVDAGLHIKK